jgi:hypothetical protein
MREGMGSKRGTIQGAYALAYRLGDPFPTYAEASWEDYGETRQQDLNGQPTSWTLNHRDGFPEAMMVKVPQSISLRLAFGLSGLVSAEELGDRPQRVQNLTSSTASTGAKVQPVVVEALGSMGDKGKTRLEAIPFTKPDAEPEPEARAEAAPAAAAGTDEPEAATGTPEPPVERQTTVDEQITDAVVVEPEPKPAPEPAAAPYDRRAHLALARKITKQRAKITALEAEQPTLESEEERTAAERLLAAQLVELARYNVAAEAAGKKRRDA